MDYFLERIAGRIAEVDRGSLYLYEGNYDKFLERKAQREESALASLGEAQEHLLQDGAGGLEFRGLGEVFQPDVGVPEDGAAVGGG